MVDCKSSGSVARSACYSEWEGLGHGSSRLKKKDEKSVCVPHTDQDISIPEDKEQNVVLCDIVEVCVFLIGKEKVWFPQTLEHVGVNS